MSGSMEKRRWSSGGPALPVVGMGTRKTFDVHGPAEEEARRRLVEETLGCGTTVFDSSPMYGEAERVLGQVLGARRKEAFIATKVWARSAAEAERQIQFSLQSFGGHIDFYQVHNLVLLPEVLPRLRALKSTGQVSLVGATHFDPRALPDLIRLLERGEVDGVQILYNAARREVEEKLLPVAERTGSGVFVMEPLGAGMLLLDEPPTALLDRLRPKGVRTWAQVLLKWVLSDPRVHVVLPATRRSGRPTENAEAGRPPWFDAEERNEISKVFDR